ncbi:MAG: chloride channel protein [Fibrobacteria bacterium]|nr:chloride channel protein [Fibrobacteria bacterium]
MVHRPSQFLAELKTLWKIQLLLRLLPGESSRAFVATLTLGAVSGLVAVLFHGTLEWTSSSLSHWVGSRPQPFRSLLLIGIPGLAGWIAGVLLYRSGLPAAGSGIPQVKAEQSGKYPVFGLRTGLMKFLLCVLQIGGGASLGREGPTVQICAATVPRILAIFALPRTMIRRFLPVASAAGIAAAFNTPIAAVTFAMEELLGSSAPTAMTGLVVAAAIASIEERLLLGSHPQFDVPSWAFESLTTLPAFLLLGILCGILGLWFHRWMVGLRGWFKGLHQFATPTRLAIGGLATGVFTLIAWELLAKQGIAGPGYALLRDSLRDESDPLSQFGMVILKSAATLASYCSGGVGGIFTPVLSIGSAIGSLVGYLQSAMPWADSTPTGAFALVGMGAFFAAVIRAPITSVLILFELTGNYGLILPLMLANMTSYLIARRKNPIPIYDAFLLQDGIHCHEVHADQPTVGDLFEPAYRVVRSDLTLSEFRDAPQPLPCIVVDEDGLCIGLVDRIADGVPGTARMDTMLRTRASLRMDDPAFPALSLMSQEGQDWLPVIDRRRRAIGMFGARDALSRLAASSNEASL